MALITTAQLVLTMGRPWSYYPTTTKEYTQIDLLRQDVEAQIKRWVNWPIELGNLPDEYKNGNGTNELILNTPYASYINNVWVDATGNYGKNPSGSFQGSPLPQGNSYALDTANNGASTLRMLAINQAWWFSECIYQRRPGGLAYNYASWWPVGFGNIKVDYWYGFNSQLGITGATWSGGILTFTCAMPVYLLPRWQIAVTGVTPATYNGTYAVNSTPDGANGNTVSVTLGSDPGSYTSGGIINAIPQDIQGCVASGVAIALNTSRYGYSITSESEGGRSVSLAYDPAFGQIRSILQKWRDMSTGGVGF